MVKFIMVTPQTGNWLMRLWHRAAAFIICKVTGSKWDHVAVVIDGYLYEEKPPHARKGAADQYAHEKIMKEVNAGFSDEQEGAARVVAEKIVGALYGLDNLLIGAVADVLSENFAHLLAGMDHMNDFDCSAFGTIIARIKWPEFLVGEFPIEVTPEKFDRELAKRMGG